VFPRARRVSEQVSQFNVREKYRGRINAFNPKSGALLGPLRDTSGNAIEIDDIWVMQFGQGGGANGNTTQLFFTAGHNNCGDGNFGVITFSE
jgi:hypothetical protein